MEITVKGTFAVTLTPQAPEEGDKDSPIGRMLLEKQFQGDLEATSRGQMLMVGTAQQGSAGYVAIERVTGTLTGRSGSFVLQHSGIMNRGAAELTLVVVPDSGTGQLQELQGSMEIITDGAAHEYAGKFILPGEV